MGWPRLGTIPVSATPGDLSERCRSTTRLARIERFNKPYHALLRG